MKKELLILYIKYKLIIYPILVGFSSIILIVLVIYPQLKEYFKGQEDTQNNRLKLKTLDAKANELEAIGQEDLEKKLQSVVSALPSEKDYTSVIGLMQRLGAEAGVNLVSVNLESGRGKEVTGISSFGVRVEITTTRLGFEEFLKRIEKAPIVMKVSSVSVDSLQGTNTVSSTIVIDVYYSPTPKSLGGLEAPLPKLSTEEEELAIKLASNNPPTPVTTAVTSPSDVAQQLPATLLPRGKSNPFE